MESVPPPPPPVKSTKGFLGDLIDLYVSPPPGSYHDIENPEAYLRELHRIGQLPPIFNVLLVRKVIEVICEALVDDPAVSSPDRLTAFPPLVLIANLERVADALGVAE
jgi:hypothetical protein